jgi:hypothetical protein
MPTEQTRYYAYLLRLWQTSSDPPSALVWRASLEDPHTGERIGFATLDHLFAYLIEQVESSKQPPATTGNEEEP